MPGMKCLPKGPIRPDIIRPIGVNPVGNWKNRLVFPICPVGRAKLFGQKNLDASHILRREICGLAKHLTLIPRLKLNTEPINTARRASGGPMTPSRLVKA